MNPNKFTTILMGAFKQLPSIELAWDTPLSEIISVLGEKKMSCAILKKANEVAGIIDKNSLIHSLASHKLDLRDVRSIDIALSKFVITSPETSLFDFLETHQQERFTHIFITSNDRVNVLRARVVRKLNQLKEETLKDSPTNMRAVRKVSGNDSLVESLRLLTDNKIEYLVLGDQPNRVITKGMISELISSQDNVWEMKISDMPTLDTPVLSQDYPTFRVLKEADTNLWPYISFFKDDQLGPNITPIRTLQDHISHQLKELMVESAPCEGQNSLSSLLEIAVDEVFGIGVAVFSPKLELVHHNKTFSELLNVKNSALSSQEGKELSDVHAVFRPLPEAVRNLTRMRPTLTLQAISNLPATCTPQISGIWDKNDLQGYILSLSTDGDIKTVKSQWEKMAYFDALTKLPNRLLLLDKISVAIKRNARNGTKFAILFVDLDGFKEVNDDYGHAFGDQVLQEVSHRFMGIMRESDTIGRLGGDEFLFILPEVQNEKDANTIIYRALECLAEPFEIEHDLIHLGCSIGMAIYPTHAETVDELISYADKKMYENKNKNKK